jgi:hypothetical protein
MTKSKRFIVNSAHFNTIICELLSFLFLCSLEYKVIYIEILQVRSVHHWVPLRFFKDFYEILKYELQIFENKEL